MKIRARNKIWLIIFLLLLQGCAFDFTPSSIPTIGFATLAPQPFQGFGPTPTDTPEMTELKEAIDMLFDPYRGTLPEDLIYEGSVYERLDIALREAYHNCGYDLSTLGYTSIENPMTEGSLLECITTKEIEDPDPFSTEKYSVLDWMYKRIVSAGEHPTYSAFFKSIGVDRTNRWNFEPNYLNALMDAYPRELLLVKKDLTARFLEWNNGDPSQALKFLEIYKLGLIGTE